MEFPVTLVVHVLPSVHQSQRVGLDRPVGSDVGLDTPSPPRAPSPTHPWTPNSHLTPPPLPGSPSPDPPLDPELPPVDQGPVQLSLRLRDRGGVTQT